MDDIEAMKIYETFCNSKSLDGTCILCKVFPCANFYGFFTGGLT